MSVWLDVAQIRAFVIYVFQFFYRVAQHSCFTFVHFQYLTFSIKKRKVTSMRRFFKQSTYCFQNLMTRSYSILLNFKKAARLWLYWYLRRWKSPQSWSAVLLSWPFFEGLSHDLHFLTFSWCSRKIGRPFNSVQAVKFLSAFEAIDDGQTIKPVISCLLGLCVSLFLGLYFRDLYSPFSTLCTLLGKIICTDVNCFGFENEMGNANEFI